MLRIFLIMLVLVPASAQASEYRGVMALAAMHPKFPCDSVLRVLDNASKPAMSVLYGTFGTSTKCINKFLSRYADRPHLLNIYFENSTARRNRKMFAGEMAPSYTVAGLNRALERNSSLIDRSVLRRLNRVLALPIERNANTAFALTVGLEDNYSSAAWRRLSSRIAPRWPGLLFRNSVNDRNNYAPLAHGVDRHVSGRASCVRDKLCMVSNDGTAFKPSEFARFFASNRHADVALAWEPQLQGRKARSRTSFSFKEPRARTFTFDPAARRVVANALKNESRR